MLSVNQNPHGYAPYPRPHPRRLLDRGTPHSRRGVSVDAEDRVHPKRRLLACALLGDGRGVYVNEREAHLMN